MQRFFTLIYNKLHEHRFLFLGLITLFFVLALYLGQRLKMEESITAMLPADDTIVADQMLVYNNFDYNNRLFLEVAWADGSSGTLDELVALSDSLYDKLAASNLFKEIVYKADETFLAGGFQYFSNHFPVLCGENQQAKLAAYLQADAISDQLVANRQLLVETPGQMVKNMVLADPLNLRQIYWPLLSGLQNVTQNEVYDGVVVSSDRRAVMLVAQTAYPATEFSRTAAMLTQVDQLIEATLTERPAGDIVIHYTGAHPAVRDNNVMIRQDIGLTVTISLLAITLLVLLVYRRIYLVLYSYIPVFFGGIIGVAIFSLFNSEIQGVVVGFSAVLIGISVDYAIHILYRFDRAPSGCKTVDILAPLALPIILGAVTTIGAFLCLLSSTLPGQRQLGIVAALGILAAMLFSLFILPQLLAAETKNRGRPFIRLDELIEHFFVWYDAHKKLVVLLLITLWIVGLTGLSKCRIDGDMRRLNGLTPASIQNERQITARWGQEFLSELLIVAVGDSWDEVFEQEYALNGFLNRAAQVGQLQKYSNPATLLLPRRLQLENRDHFAKIVADSGSDNIDLLPNLAAAVGFKAPPFEKYLAELHDSSNSELITADAFSDAAPQIFSAYYSRDAAGRYLGLTRVTLNSRQAAQLIPGLVRDFPQLHWYSGQQYTDHLSALVSSAMWRFGMISLAVVCLIVLLTLGRLELLLLVVYAMGSALIWTLGLMGHLQVSINLMSSLFVVFVFGMSVDYVIFVINDMILSRQNQHGSHGTTCGAIILSALTTIFALGSLALAQHPAMSSVGFTAAIGMSSGMLAALLAVPMLVRPLSTSGQARVLPTLANIINTILGYGCFGLGAFFGVIIVYPLCVLFSFRKPALLEQRLNHYLRFICRLTLWLMPFGRVTVRGRENLHTDKARIIIANHESMLDILLAQAYLGDFRMIVKNWVWKVPFMGFLVKRAGFLLVDGNNEALFAAAAAKLEAGLNLLIFPEGSRQNKRQLGRFHRGAFELALQCRVPLQPVVFADSRSSIPKNSILVGRYAIDLSILPPLEPAPDSHDAARECQHLLWLEYEQCRKRLAASRAFLKELLGYYSYTGPYIENYCYFKTLIDPIFRNVDALLPREGTILDLGCGYGLMSNILAFGSPERQIFALDYDDDKLRIAASCTMFPKDISYVCGDLMTAELPLSSGAVLIDVLHYWPRDQQLAMVRKIYEALLPGSILVMREGCRGDRGYSGVNFWEKFATSIGHNKTKNGLNFLTVNDYVALLTEAGFEVKEQLTQLGRGSNTTFVCYKK